MAQATDQLPNTQSQFLVKAEGLSKRFNREWIFKNLNHTFQSGKTYAITGPNGSGKSTLLQVLWGQLPQSSGTIKYSSGNTEIPVEEIFKTVSIAAPYMDLIEELTLQEQIHFHFKLRKPIAGYGIDTILEKLYLTDSRDKQLFNFSSGMKQRVKLGLAFYTESDMIFLDEPGTNLDEQAFRWYTDNLNLLPKNRLVFIASNQPAEYPPSAVIINVAAIK
jgi:ABC-type multidrug transport system ATPase subunit